MDIKFGNFTLDKNIILKIAMNNFQQQLNDSLKEINKVSEIIFLQDIVSKLDVDVLLEKIRGVYGILISFSNEDTSKKSQEQEKAVDLTHLELKIEEIKQILDSKTEPAINIKELKEEIKQELIKEKTLEFHKSEQKKEESKPEPVIEKIEDKEAVKQEIRGDEKPNILIDKVLDMAKQEPRIEIKKEEKVIENKEETKVVEAIEDREEIAKIDVKKEENKQEPAKEQAPSVLQYLNENIIKEAENNPRHTQSSLELFAEKSNTTVAEKYEQPKSKHESIVSSNNISSNEKLIKPVNDLRTAIGVNEKFMFINDLFTGDLREYTEFIQKLNDSPSLEDARRILNETKNRRKWIGNSLSFTTLELVVDRRFQ